MRPEKRHKYSDEKLVRLLRETGNHAYFEVLYDRYFPKTYYQVISYLKDPDAAKDLTQDIFLRLYDRLSQFRYRSSFSTWLYRIARNLCLDYLRKEGRLSLRRDDQSQFEQIPEVSDQELFNIQTERLKTILDLLPVLDKELLMMKYGYDWQIEEISEVTDVSVGAIKMRLKRAKAKVKGLYQQLYENLS